jgi:hypothetical protein
LVTGATFAVDYFLPKIGEPPVWVAMAVWSHDEVLLVLASHPAVLGAPGWYWSSL